MSVIKRGKSWRAAFMHEGTRYTATFDTKRQAEKWEEVKREELGSGLKRAVTATFGDLMLEYNTKVSVHKKGHRWENVRIQALQHEDIAKIQLSVFDTPDIVVWRDARLKQVSPSTVKREMNLMSHACEVARREWKWITENPFKDVKKPTEPRHRERIITDAERDTIVANLGYSEGMVPTRASHRVALVFLFALETAMRSSEICNLKHSDVVGKVAIIRDSKNGQGRQVPLTDRAVEIVKTCQGNEYVFGVTPASRDAIFRKARAGMDLTFHDARHTATTRLARVFSERGLSVLDLARVTGHTDLKQLLKYFNPSIEDLANKINQR